MVSRRRRQRRQENRSVPSPVVAPTPPNRPEEAAASNIPGDPTDRNQPSNSPHITRLERCKQILEAVKETIMERIVDIAILLGKFCRGIRRGISLLDMVSYVVLIVASQLWLSISIVENLVFLIILSGINFQFPFPHFAKFIVKSKDYLAGNFRLLVLSCVCIAFVNDVFMSNCDLSPVQRCKIYWNVFFAQIIMYAFIPFMNSFADIMNVVLAILSFARIAVEMATNCTSDDMLASMNFLPPHALLFHFLFISILSIILTYYEAEKFLDKLREINTRVPPPQN